VFFLEGGGWGRETGRLGWGTDTLHPLVGCLEDRFPPPPPSPHVPVSPTCCPRPPAPSPSTGRKRRCGWLDIPVLRYTHMINGYSSMNLTKVWVCGGVWGVYVGVCGCMWVYVCVCLSTCCLSMPAPSVNRALPFLVCPACPQLCLPSPPCTPLAPPCLPPPCSSASFPPQLDVLDGLDYVKIGVAYKVDGVQLPHGKMPSSLEALKAVEVVYESTCCRTGEPAAHTHTLHTASVSARPLSFAFATTATTTTCVLPVVPVTLKLSFFSHPPPPPPSSVTHPPSPSRLVAAHKQGPHLR
jgi:hypothetical protein